MCGHAFNFIEPVSFRASVYPEGLRNNVETNFDVMQLNGNKKCNFLPKDSYHAKKGDKNWTYEVPQP
jgi:hypothetical protein